MTILEKKLDNLSDRLNYALEITGVRQVDLAKSLGVKAQTIQFLRSSATKSSRFTFEIATILGLNSEWLATGEGELFLIDDPKEQIFNECKKIPIVNINQLLEKVDNPNYLSTCNFERWAFIQTNDINVFCLSMPDMSMQPIIPFNSIVFFKELDVSYSNFKGSEVVIAYLSINQSIIIRKIEIKNSLVYLSPIDKILFNEVLFSDDVKILGIAISCHIDFK